MLPEIAAAVGFLSSLLRTRGCVSEQRLKVFSGALQEALTGEHPPRILASVEPRLWGSVPLPSCLGRLSSPLRAGLPSRAAPELGFPPAPRAARIPPLPWVVSPLSCPALVSVRDGSGRARSSTLSRTQTLVLECEPWRRLLSREEAPAGLSASSFTLLRLSRGAGGESARPANGSLWGKKAQLSLHNNLDPQPWFFGGPGAALCPGQLLTRSKLESRPPLYALAPLSHLPPIMVLRKACR